jgi:hypothetical protein
MRRLPPVTRICRCLISLSATCKLFQPREH